MTTMLHLYYLQVQSIRLMSRIWSGGCFCSEGGVGSSEIVVVVSLCQVIQYTVHTQRKTQHTAHDQYDREEENSDQIGDLF